MKIKLLLQDTDCALCGESMPKGSVMTSYEDESYCDECMEDSEMFHIQDTIKDHDQTIALIVKAIAEINHDIQKIKNKLNL